MPVTYEVGLPTAGCSSTTGPAAGTSTRTTATVVAGLLAAVVGGTGGLLDDAISS